MALVRASTAGQPQTAAGRPSAPPAPSAAPPPTWREAAPSCAARASALLRCAFVATATHSPQRRR